MSFWDSLRIGASGLNAQQLRLDIISNNIANAETTHTAEGGPYKRQDVVFSAPGQQSFLPSLVLARRNQTITASNVGASGVQVSSVITSNEPGPKVYDPTNPDADKQGYVTYPNVDLVTEMTNMISATRSYEANLAAINASKQMALQALNIGK
ncbi:MAG TPA: flagellar basal body rod protein FlgC [Anaerolineaceae bacterium]|nr:flagellar basal body rod protein FlgC [Anaerolineaceae bacterium]